MNVDTITSKSNTNIKMVCIECGREKTLKHNRKDLDKNRYRCQSCNKKGDRNPFYNKQHSEKSKRKMGGSVKNYNGENNPFYGKIHTKETIERIKSNPEIRRIGSKNGFYGKKHKLDSIETIREKNRLFREQNQELIISHGLKRIGKTKEELFKIFEEYLKGFVNRDMLLDYYGNDFRTLKHWWIKLGFISKTDLDNICAYKKINSNPSAPEHRLYKMLMDKYGKENVAQHYELNGYYYDICLFGKFLVEYDGYYWHKIVKNKNDSIKNKLAHSYGYTLYRVEEEKNREVNFDKELETINKML